MVSEIHTAYYKSPIGTIEVKGNSKEIHSIYFIEEDISTTLEVTSGEIKKCIQQLDEYFLGNRKEFELNLSPNGTEFQGKVWTELLKVPFGKTRSYLEQSKKLGDVKAIRAVASANGKNPISIIIPCHRIVGSDGSLTGYAGGVWRKKWLLEHENGNKQQSLF
ncbi:methylated-DNA-[protein]-cysteine S-methyltransferase [Tenacibaculum skagerrakense]|uniref:Methylated-DNA--protein-cysteine methyltransferase n=1 Tax=Tenacibaculum skagerrakense TaxID=186571 RepID=A0A4V2SMR6_9FLAO|nr:methylated-DNA-[protein]-cysteine S-methyltransferase [Tenacibaculum skagerrakense]